MKYLVGTMCGGLMEDPEPRFDGPYLIVEASDEETARKFYNKATNGQYGLKYALNEAKIL